MAKRKKPVGAPSKPESEKVVPILFYTNRKNVDEIGGVENARVKAKELFENHINPQQ
jgi:hypothetical protein